MTKINKLNQTFVPQTEATAESQNLQSDKIDEVIDAITTSNGTVAFPVTKGGVEYKITTIGSNLSVSDNTLNSSAYTLPVASTSTLGGVKVGDGLSIVASGTNIGKLSVDHDDTLTFVDGKLSVSNPGEGTGAVTSASDPVKIESKVVGLKYDTTLKLDSNGKLAVANPAKVSSVNSPLSLNNGAVSLSIDNSTIKVNGSGQLYSTVSGGVSAETMNNSITSAINNLNVSEVGGTDKYIQKISEANGKISATAASLPTTSLDNTNGVHTLKYSTTSLLSVNDNTQFLTIGGDTYFLIKISTAVYYSINSGSKIQLSGTTLSITGSQHATSLDLLVPATKTLTVKDSMQTPVTSDFVETGLILYGGALYTKYSYVSENYISQDYSITVE